MVNKDLVPATSALLNVRNLNAICGTQSNAKTLLHDISFSLSEGEVIAVVGESGSGKTTLLRALTNLFSSNTGIVVSGEVDFEGRNLLTLDENKMNEVRKKSISQIFQEAALSLNPVLRIKSQLQIVGIPLESQIHDKQLNDAKNLTQFLFEMGIKEPLNVLRSYPHQLSTGMAQRVSIAMAMARKPQLLLADEPTSAIDAVIRSRVLTFLSKQCRTDRMGLLLSTHDLSSAKRFADTIIVLYAGRIIETSPAKQFFENPLHPYSKMLLKRDASESNNTKLDLSEKAQMGCMFENKCPFVQNDCLLKEPELLMAIAGRKVRCYYWK